LSLKLLIFALSLVLSLTVLEAGLRIAGYVFTASRTSAFIPPYEDRIPDADYAFERYRSGKTTRLILTLGDSLTNAGNVKSYDSYPYFLYKNFTEAGENVAVYNLAKCEESTFGVVSKLEKYFKAEPANPAPDDVVVLAGAADLFNLPLIKKRMDEMETDGTSWQDVLPGGWLYGLRIYKVFRHIRMNLAWRLGLLDEDDEGGVSREERLAVLLDVYRAHKKAAGSDASKRLDSSLVEKVRAVFTDDELDYDDLDISTVADFSSFLADYASIVYTPQVRYDKFFELLLDMAKTYPGKFWTPDFDTAGYYFVQTYRMQSRYTAEDVMRVLDGALLADPALNKNQSFLSFRKFLTDRYAMDEFVDARRADAWEKIVAMSRRWKFRLVLQTYPVEYKSANRMLSGIASKYGLALVDNEARFKDIIADGGRESIMEDNDHLTPEGYRRMAGFVYEELRRSPLAGEVSGR
jgi:lysophospholipase L1-like esterase